MKKKRIQDSRFKTSPNTRKRKLFIHLYIIQSMIYYHMSLSRIKRRKRRKRRRRGKMRKRMGVRFWVPRGGVLPTLES